MIHNREINENYLIEKLLENKIVLLCNTSNLYYLPMLLLLSSNPEIKDSVIF